MLFLDEGVFYHVHLPVHCLPLPPITHKISNKKHNYAKQGEVTWFGLDGFQLRFESYDVEVELTVLKGPPCVTLGGGLVLPPVTCDTASLSQSSLLKVRILVRPSLKEQNIIMLECSN